MLFWLVDSLILWNRSKYRHFIRKWWMAKWIRSRRLYQKIVEISFSKFWPRIRTSDHLLMKSLSTNGSRNRLITSMYHSTHAWPGEHALNSTFSYLVGVNERIIEDEESRTLNSDVIRILTTSLGKISWRYWCSTSVVPVRVCWDKESQVECVRVFLKRNYRFKWKIH